MGTTRHLLARAIRGKAAMAPVILVCSCAGRCGADTHPTSSVSVTPDDRPAPSGPGSAPRVPASSRGDAPSEGCPDGTARLEGGTLSVRRKVPVFIAPMCMDRTEVTVKSYAECVAGGVCPEPGTGEACNWGVPDRESRPVNCVDLPSAEAFCKRRSARVPTHD